MGRSLANSRNSLWAPGEAAHLNHLLVFEREQGRANRPGAHQGLTGESSLRKPRVQAKVALDAAVSIIPGWTIATRMRSRRNVGRPANR